MNKHTEALEAFLLDESNFITKLRFLEGLDKPNIQILLNILEEIGNEIKNKELIEKKLAFLLIEIEPTLISTATSYSGKEYEDILNEIGHISMKISSILASN